jgi:hypothetical protein
MLLPALRKLMWFTVLGFATVTLTGPVLAVLGTLLPFALVGALVWLAYKGVLWLAGRVRGQEKPALPDVLQDAGREARRVFAQGIQKCSGWAPAVRRWAPAVHRWPPAARCRLRRAGEWVAVRGRAAGRRLFEVLCGALVGALVSWSITGAVDDYTALGALVGAALGVVAGGSKPQQSRELVAAK